MNKFVTEDNGVPLIRRGVNLPKQIVGFVATLKTRLATTEEDRQEGLEEDSMVTAVNMLSQAQEEELFITSKEHKSLGKSQTKGKSGRRRQKRRRTLPIRQQRRTVLESSLL